ncbi:hypothetical protein Skr01_72500 [Sphaerisporangium krabiense]|nr:hypothetical protein Skr01_72500 [Sphaerisporangium krabiense]
MGGTLFINLLGDSGRATADREAAGPGAPGRLRFLVLSAGHPGPSLAASRSCWSHIPTGPYTCDDAASLPGYAASIENDGPVMTARERTLEAAGIESSPAGDVLSTHLK